MSAQAQTIAAGIVDGGGLAAIRALPDDPALLAGTGETLLRRGAFELGEAALERALALEPDNYAALLAMAALHNRWGDPESAAQCVRAAARRRPVVTDPDAEPGLPDVLRLRSVEGVRYGTTFNRETGAYRLMFKGAHFSVENLIDRETVNLHVANVLGDNLLEADLPPVDLVVNTIADADKGRPGLEAAARFLAARPDLPVINHPARVLETSRDGNHRRLSGIEGAILPLTARVSHGGKPRRLAADLEKMGFTYPYILRLAGTQTGASVIMVGSRDQARKIFRLSAPDLVFHIIAFHDCRDDRGRFRKMRCFFIDGRFFPVACLGSDHWEIHSGDRYRIMDRDPDLQAQERRWLDDPEGYLGAQNMARLHAVRDIVGLDFFGIDFSLTKGELILFEVNPAMRHNFDHATAFPYTRPHLERVSAAFHAMVIERCARVRPLSANL
jgi:tetratricopeptide (TPR) repeat protein